MDDDDRLLSVLIIIIMEFFFLGKYNKQKNDLTSNTAVPCPSGSRSVRICEVCCRVMVSVLTSIPSVRPLTLLGAGESTVSSWTTGVETSSCLMGLNEIQQKIRRPYRKTSHSLKAKSSFEKPFRLWMARTRNLKHEEVFL